MADFYNTMTDKTLRNHLLKTETLLKKHPKFARLKAKYTLIKKEINKRLRNSKMTISNLINL